MLTSPDLEKFCALKGTSALTPESCLSKHPDLNCLIEKSGKTAARCSLWWSGTPDLDGKKTGLIGHYAAVRAEEGSAILNKAAEILRENGCKTAVGPMDGSTWHSYRLITWSGGSPPFFLEISHPADWPAHFESSGFSLLSEYFSSMTGTLTAIAPEMAQNERLHSIQVRPFNPDEFEQELERIYDLSLRGFRDNLLYADISREAFLRLYQPLKGIMDSRLVAIAEESTGGSPVGFLFAIPDFLEKSRSGKIETMIFKSMAVIPEFRGIGIGNLLFAECQRKAVELGYKRAIHAYIHENNVSGKISKTFGGPGFERMRRYTLFAKELEKKG